MEIIQDIPIVKIKLERIKNIKYSGKLIGSEEVAAEIIKDLIADSDREKMVVVCLDIRNHINNVSICSIGSNNNSIVNPYMIYKTAILSNSNNIIIGHNHPSGDLGPSKEDINITKRLLLAGSILDIHLLDHIIVNDSREQYSLRKSISFTGIDKELLKIYR